MGANKTRRIPACFQCNKGVGLCLHVRVYAIPVYKLAILVWFTMLCTVHVCVGLARTVYIHRI